MPKNAPYSSQYMFKRHVITNRGAPNTKLNAPIFFKNFHDVAAWTLFPIWIQEYQTSASHQSLGYFQIHSLIPLPPDIAKLACDLHLTNRITNVFINRHLRLGISGRQLRPKRIRNVFFNRTNGDRTKTTFTQSTKRLHTDGVLCQKHDHTLLAKSFWYKLSRVQKILASLN